MCPLFSAVVVIVLKCRIALSKQIGNGNKWLEMAINGNEDDNRLLIYFFVRLF